MFTNKQEEKITNHDLADYLYGAGVTAVKGWYEPRIKKYLGELKMAMEDMKWTVQGPDDWTDGEYTWNFLIFTDGRGTDTDTQDDDVDVTFTLVESKEREGTREGISFSLGVCAVGGAIIGGMSPFNYTDKLWVSLNDPDGIEERFCLFENADVNDLIKLIDTWSEQ